MSDEPHRILVNAVRVMLKPIVRFCLRHALRVQDIMECVKVALIEVAQEEMQWSPGKFSICRMSAMTGVHRRDVTRIFKHEETKETPQGTINKIIGQWLHDRRFISRSGEPRVLTVSGHDSEFKKLVSIISNDITPGTILLELERVGAIERTPAGIKLTKRGYLSKGDLPQAITLMASDTNDLMSAVLQNVSGPSDLPNLHAKTHYDKIPTSAVPKIREWLHREGSALHHKARLYLSQFDLDIHPEGNKDVECVRVALGTFSLVENPKTGTKL